MANETNVPHVKPTTLEGWVKLLDSVRLPVPQEAHDKVCRAIRDNRSSLRDIADLMQDSPALALSIIREANRHTHGTLAAAAEHLEVAINRLGLARKMGVTRAVNVAQESLADVMAELGMTEGFDVDLEMSGAPPAFRTMLDTMNHGGRIAMLGIPPSDMSIDWTKVIFKGLFIKGIYGREMFETWYKMAALIQTGLDLSPIITHRFGIDDFQQGFDAMRSGQSGKVILSWD